MVNYEEELDRLLGLSWEQRRSDKDHAEGQRKMLLRQLGRRFGALPEAIAARVAQATADDLERWGDRVIDAASLDDVFA